MRLFKTLMIVFLIAGIWSSCQKEYFKTPAFDPNAVISFNADLQPILSSKCTNSGCHNGSVSPNLTSGKAYASLNDGGYLDTLNPSQSILMIKLNTNMPPGKLPPATISKFLLWMSKGAKE